MRRRFSIRNKILSIFILIIVFFAGNTILNIYYLDLNQQVTNQITEYYFPSDSKLGELNLIFHNSKSYINTWVHTDINSNEKIALKKIHSEDWPQINKALINLSENWESKAQKDSLANILAGFDELVTKHQTLMKTLSTFEDYFDILKVSEAEELRASIFQETDLLIDQLIWVRGAISDNLNEGSKKMLNSRENQRFSNTTVGVLVMLISLVIGIILSRSITRPIHRLRSVIGKMSQGELPDDKLEDTNDEIGEMTVEVNTLIGGLKKVSGFAEDIGQGQLESEFTPLSNKDVLGNSLLTMRGNLYQVAQEDEQRNWANEGLTQFGEVLRRSENLDIEDFCYEIISSLIKYMKLNQGWLYLVEQGENEKGDEETYLELKACYAYSRKKYIAQRITIGQGLTGQCWQEGEKIYMNDVPNDYTTIQSGTGGANPSAVLIVPLQVNQEIFGIMEIAGFRDLQTWEIEFVERVADMIASTISVARINERTRTLLADSQSLTENLRAQEEEMRQNFEELRSTQEEMNRRETQLKDRIKELEDQLGEESKAQ